LIFEHLVWRSPTLEVPHPRFHERAFALVPAAEVAPTWMHPLIGRTLAELAAAALATDPEALISSEPWRPRR
jgi:2-amino-4-hydroxy-6-hydroxymethyldihydropteridine diphosphokinase